MASSSGPKVVPPRFRVQPRPSSCVTVPPRLVKPPEAKVDQMTMYGTSLPATVTKAEVMLHCLVWCGVKPVADLITVMRPTGGSEYSSCVVGLDSQIVCSRAIAKLDRLPFEGSSDPKPCRWKLAHIRSKPRAGPVFRRQQWQDELSPVSPVKEEPSPDTPTSPITRGPWYRGVKLESEDDDDGNKHAYGVQQVDPPRPSCCANIMDDPEI